MAIEKLKSSQWRNGLPQFQQAVNFENLRNCLTSSTAIYLLDGSRPSSRNAATLAEPRGVFYKTDDCPISAVSPRRKTSLGDLTA